ncbi:UNVERIFIED_CONTAM: hypothetical protein K2H54_020989 [Gekko kuhli]
MVDNIKATIKRQLAGWDALGLGSAENPNLDTETNEFRHLLQKCRHIVSHLSRSTKDLYLLCEKQTLTGVPEHYLLSDVSTHWNSTCVMLEHLEELENALTALISKGRVIPEESRLS